jgi:sugar lactone lactonase YvrE
MPRRLWLALALAGLLLAACGEVPTPPAAYSSSPTALQPGETVWQGPTALPYPMPTREPPSTRVPRTPTPPGPTPIVLGTELAPPDEQIAYVSTTVVVAPVGDGPGQIGVAYTGDFPIAAESFAVDASGNIYVLDEINHRVAEFDPQGRFVANVVYGDAVGGPAGLAVDASGWVYIYDAVPEGARVRLFDQKGSLVRDYPIPSWLSQVAKMQIDPSGTLWIESSGIYPNAPFIEDTTYYWGAVPLGNAREVFDEEYQESQAMPGHLCDSGKTLITYWLTAGGPAYAYNLQGQRIYEIPEGLVCVDGNGNPYALQDRERGQTIIRWNTQGKRIAAFDLPGGATLVQSNGTVYNFFWDREANVYRVTRSQPAR